MNDAFLAIGLHFHQPIGNFEDILERALKNCYLPLIETIYAYPDVKLSLHISGCLLDYFESKHSQIILEKISEMAARGQIELIGGAYYEPILTAIPKNDLIGQIKMMQDYLRRKFNYPAKGMWIPERVWAPELSSVLNSAGVKYCILDDTHFLKIGIAKEKLYGYFTTGGKSKDIAVFASDKKLRYSIPFGQSDEIINYFREIAQKQKEPLFVYGDDAEKFGEWPGTYKWVFEEGWLKNFLEALKTNSSWLKTIHFSEYLKKIPAQDNLELKEASYDEMMEWNNGSWMNFLDKYPESNQMHKKMCYVSSKLTKALKTVKDRQILQEAQRHLYKGQCNCGYWHGVFGGLYLYHLRNAIYNHLIEADKIIDGIMQKNKYWNRTNLVDFDQDGIKEVIYEDRNLALYFDPQEGGVLKELDYRPLAINFINTLSRKKEPYHAKIAQIRNSTKEELIHTIHEDYKKVDPLINSNFIYDPYPRYCFRDHFINEDTNLVSFINGSFGELGDFSSGAYTARKNGKITLIHSARIREKKITLIKEFMVKSECQLQAVYSIEGDKKDDLPILFGVEFNLTMPHLNSGRYSYYSLDSKPCSLEEQNSLAKSDSFTIADAEKEISLRFDFSRDTEKIWYFPVKTISQSERAYELNFQCSCIMPLWKLNFSKEKKYRLMIDLSFMK